jgi:hypothetical protein
LTRTNQLPRPSAIGITGWLKVTVSESCPAREGVRRLAENSQFYARLDKTGEQLRREVRSQKNLTTVGDRLVRRHQRFTRGDSALCVHNLGFSLPCSSAFRPSPVSAAEEAAGGFWTGHLGRVSTFGGVKGGWEKQRYVPAHRVAAVQALEIYSLALSGPPSFFSSFGGLSSLSNASLNVVSGCAPLNMLTAFIFEGSF